MTKHETNEDKIRKAAFELWLSEGRPEGRADAHWHQARAALEAASPAPKRRAAKPKAAGAAKAKAPGTVKPNTKPAAKTAKPAKVAKPASESRRGRLI